METNEYKHLLQNQLRLLILVFTFTTIFLNLDANAESRSSGFISPIFSLLLEDEEEEVICGSITPETTITGDQNISSQANINSLASTTKVVGNISITTAVSLDLSPLKQLIEVTGGITVDLSGITSIRSFDCLKRIENSLVFSLNTNLINISDFVALEFVGGSIFIDGNPNLSAVPAFPLLRTVGGSLNLTQISATSIRTPGFRRLESVGNDMRIAETNLNSLTGFDTLTTINGFLRIENNSSLMSIPTFQALTTVDSADPMGFVNLSISFNQLLSSIDGFQSLNLANIDSIFVDSNPMFNCPTELPNFVNITSSAGNAVNCLSF